MTFDFEISLFDEEGFFDEEAVEAYTAELLKRFAASPEGQSVLSKDALNEPVWTEFFLTAALYRLQIPLQWLWPRDLRDILYNGIPAAAMVPASEAENIIQELKAFYSFLKREFKLRQAADCLKVLNQKTIVNRLKKEMSDTSKFSPTKKLLMQAQEAGVDITSNDQMQVFVDQYNQQIMAENEKAAEKLTPKKQAIIDILTPICEQHLNEDYAKLGQEMAEELAHYHPSPLAKGREKSWAAGIVYALGRINFLSDPSIEPYMKMEDLCKLFGVSQSTAGAKSSDIINTMDLMQFDPDWTLPSMADQNPLMWMMVVNGFPVDIRTLPRDVQVQAYEQGLIPYIPADKED